MNSNLVILGAVIIVGAFILLNIVITPQMRSDIGVSAEFCGSFFGQIAGANLPSYAEECRTKQVQSQVLFLEPVIYAVGFIVLFAGLVAPISEIHIVRSRY